MASGRGVAAANGAARLAADEDGDDVDPKLLRRPPTAQVPPPKMRTPRGARPGASKDIRRKAMATNSHSAQQQPQSVSVSPSPPRRGAPLSSPHPQNSNKLQLDDDIMDMKAELRHARKDRDRAVAERGKIMAEVGSLQQLQEDKTADNEHARMVQAALDARVQGLLNDKENLAAEVAQLQGELPGLRQSATMLDLLSLEHENLMLQSADDKQKLRKSALRQMVISLGHGVAGRCIARWKVAIHEAQHQDRRCNALKRIISVMTRVAQGEAAWAIHVMRLQCREHAASSRARTAANAQANERLREIAVRQVVAAMMRQMKGEIACGLQMMRMSHQEHIERVARQTQRKEIAARQVGAAMVRLMKGQLAWTLHLMRGNRLEEATGRRNQRLMSAHVALAATKRKQIEAAARQVGAAMMRLTKGDMAWGLQLMRGHYREDVAAFRTRASFDAELQAHNRICRKKATRLMSRAFQNMAEGTVRGAILVWRAGQMSEISSTIKLKMNAQMNQLQSEMLKDQKELRQSKKTKMEDLAYLRRSANEGIQASLTEMLRQEHDMRERRKDIEVQHKGFGIRSLGKILTHMVKGELGVVFRSMRSHYGDVKADLMIAMRLNKEVEDSQREMMTQRFQAGAEQERKMAELIRIKKEVNEDLHAQQALLLIKAGQYRESEKGMRQKQQFQGLQAFSRIMIKKTRGEVGFAFQTMRQQHTGHCLGQDAQAAVQEMVEVAEARMRETVQSKATGMLRRAFQGVLRGTVRGVVMAWRAGQIGGLAQKLQAEKQAEMAAFQVKLLEQEKQLSDKETAGVGKFREDRKRMNQDMSLMQEELLEKQNKTTAKIKRANQKAQQIALRSIQQILLHWHRGVLHSTLQGLKSQWSADNARAQVEGNRREAQEQAKAQNAELAVSMCESIARKSDLKKREGALLDKHRRLGLRVWSAAISTWQKAACMRAVHQWNNQYEDDVARQEWHQEFSHVQDNSSHELRNARVSMLDDRTDTDQKVLMLRAKLKDTKRELQRLKRDTKSREEHVAVLEGCLSDKEYSLQTRDEAEATKEAEIAMLREAMSQVENKRESTAFKRIERCLGTQMWTFLQGAVLVWRSKALAEQASRDAKLERNNVIGDLSGQLMRLKLEINAAHGSIEEAAEASKLAQQQQVAQIALFSADLEAKETLIGSLRRDLAEGGVRDIKRQKNTEVAEANEDLLVMKAKLKQLRSDMALQQGILEEALAGQVDAEEKASDLKSMIDYLKEDLAEAQLAILHHTNAKPSSD